MYIWTPDALYFRKDAERYTKIGAQKAALIRPYLEQNAYICDAGCGLGHTALELARLGYRVDAVDSSPQALQVLRDIVEEEPSPLPSLHIIQEDLFQKHPREFYTDMIFSFFGDVREILQLSRQMCKGRIYVIQKKSDNPVMTEWIRYLTTHEIPYTEQDLEPEMGQPFRSAQDATLFFALHGNTDSIPEWEDILPYLEETGDPVFPYFYSARKQLTMVTVKADDIRKMG